MMRRTRRILTAFIVTLLTGAVLLGLIGFIRWRGRQAVQSDARTVIAQTGRQLLRALQSRRGTLAFMRDALSRRPDLTPMQLRALGKSAVGHTRHLLAIGLVHAAPSPAWWATAPGLSTTEIARLNRAITQRSKPGRSGGAAFTVGIAAPRSRALLVMLEPLRGAAGRGRAVAGVFDVKPLLEDFFAASLPQRVPAQALDGGTLLARSASWRGAAAERRLQTVEQPVRLDAVRWTLQMQLGGTSTAQTLSWFNLLLIGLSAIAGLSVTIIVWILAARAWILQRAVARRTAALRRALKRLRRMAVTDELTGLYNRRFFLNRWTWECQRAKRYQRPLACLMIDVNGFKHVNDRLGHPAGDLVLRQVARELSSLLRQSDILARFGGDEFIVALPETSPEQAATVAEKLRQVQIRVPDGEGRGVPAVSLSVGMSRVERIDDSPDDILEAADQSLYAHKHHHLHAATGRRRS